MIRIICHTNRDEGNGKKWPEWAEQPVMVGDCVQAEGGYRLQVCSITHVMRKTYRGEVEALVPMVLVELNK